MELTNKQQLITDELISWYENPEVPIVAVGGYAGTGKTVLISKFRGELRKRGVDGINIAYCAYTGKAASVLKKKLNFEGVIEGGDTVSTIHGLIYRPKVEYDEKLKRKVLTGWIKRAKEEFPYDLIIIDEASMVTDKLLQDLFWYNVPIIAVGDHGQLPPVGNDKSYISNPDFALTEIHRQALGSPIIRLSMEVRKTGRIDYDVNCNEIQRMNWNTKRAKNTLNSINFHRNNIIAICAFNNSRVQLNNIIRANKGYSGNVPSVGERVICIKNNHESNVMNGMLGTVLESKPSDDLADMPLHVMNMNMDDMEEDEYETAVHHMAFNKEKYEEVFKLNMKKMKGYAKKLGFKSGYDVFDFGYAISCHKSQGSEWDNVVLFEQKSSFWDEEYYMRWLYTGLTRAKNKLLLIQNFY